MLWMCLHFPKLALEVYTHNQHIETPFAIAETQNNKRFVLLCNAQATAEGVQAGITMPTAHSLCEHLIVKERDKAVEKKTLQQIALHISPFSPTITFQSPNNILLEIGSCLRLFGGLKNFHEKIQTQTRHLNYSFKLAVAKTPLAAEIAAKLLEDEKKYLISDAYLKQIPIDALNYRLPNKKKAQSILSTQATQRDIKTIQRLQGMGFRRLGEILDLPKPELGRRFGKPFLTYLDKLTGKTLDTRDTFKPPVYFEHHIHFVEELTALNSLLFPLKRLLEDLETYLQQRQLEITSLAILLENRNNQTDPISIQFAEPQHRSDQILPLIHLKFETLTLSEPIITVGLKADQLVEQRIKIDTLFSPDDPFLQDNSSFQNKTSDSDRATLINRLTARLGNEQVQSLMLREDHRPENCWTYTPPMMKAFEKTAKEKTSNQDPPQQQTSRQKQQPRPLWLLSQPQQLPYRGGQLFWHGPLTLLNGPERIDTGWWDNNPVNRDYYIAQHQKGELLWVFKNRERELSTAQTHTPERVQWFLHGIFS